MALNLNLFGKKKKSVDPIEQQQVDAEKYTQEKLEEFSRGLVTIQDIIAPEAIEVDFTYQKINDTFTRTLFIADHP